MARVLALGVGVGVLGEPKGEEMLIVGIAGD